MISSHKHRAKQAFKKAQPKPRATLVVQWADGTYHDFDGNPVDLKTISGAALTMSPNVARAVDHKAIIIDEDDAQL